MKCFEEAKRPWDCFGAGRWEGGVRGTGPHNQDRGIWLPILALASAEWPWANHAASLSLMFIFTKWRESLLETLVWGLFKITRVRWQEQDFFFFPACTSPLVRLQWLTSWAYVLRPTGSWCGKRQRAFSCPFIFFLLKTVRSWPTVLKAKHMPYSLFPSCGWQLSRNEEAGLWQMLLSHSESPLLQQCLWGAALFSPVTLTPWCWMIPRVTQESCHWCRGVRGL